MTSISGRKPKILGELNEFSPLKGSESEPGLTSEMLQCSDKTKTNDTGTSNESVVVL